MRKRNFSLYKICVLYSERELERRYKQSFRLFFFVVVSFHSRLDSSHSSHNKWIKMYKHKFRGDLQIAHFTRHIKDLSCDRWPSVCGCISRIFFFASLYCIQIVYSIKVREIRKMENLIFFRAIECTTYRSYEFEPSIFLWSLNFFYSFRRMLKSNSL